MKKKKKPPVTELDVKKWMDESMRKCLDLAVKFVKEHEGDKERCDEALKKLKAFYAKRDIQ